MYFALAFLVSMVFGAYRLSGHSEFHVGSVELFQPFAHGLTFGLIGYWLGRKVEADNAYRSHIQLTPRAYYLTLAGCLTAVEVIAFVMSRRSMIILVALGLTVGTIVPVSGQTVEAWLPLPPSNMQAQRVERVIDGDTIVLVRGGERITCRLLGIDAPELPTRTKYEFFGPEAAAYLKKWVEGKTVRVSYQGPQATRDRYGRPLVYLWADRGTQNVNVELVSRGFARYEKGYQTKYRESFKAAEEAAQRYGLGLWAKAPTQP